MVPPLRTTNKSRRSRFAHNVHYVVVKLTILLQAVAWAPQRGNNNSVELPSKLPKDDYLLKDLEPLGWIKTQALELPHLSPNDITSQAKIMADHPEWGSSSICITAAFTPGSVSLSAHSLTVPGFEWGRKNQDTSPNPQVSFYVPDPFISS
jgi:pre-mRNA-processing factor 8